MERRRHRSRAVLREHPDGAWAEFVRHEEIVDESDLLGVRRAMWVVDLPAEADDFADPDLPPVVLIGGLDSYAECQAEAERLRHLGGIGLRAPSAALLPGTAGGYRVELGLRSAEPRDGVTYVAFGAMPGAVAWQIVDEGRPPARILPSVRALA